MKNELEKILRSIVSEMHGDVPPGELIKSSDLNHGDYVTNIALVLSKQLKKSPMDIAQEIADELEDIKGKYGLKKIEVVKPGFINFWMSDAILRANIMAKGSQVDHIFAGKKVIVEYTDPNPFKEFHIGHVYTNTIGEALSRLFEKTGAAVRRVTYQGDIGLHVAKPLWGMEKLFAENTEVTIETLRDANASARAQFLGKAYACGAKAYEEDEQAKAEIVSLNKKVYASDPETMILYRIGRAWSLEYFEGLYCRLGSNFDRYFFESEVEEQGKKFVLAYLKDGIFEESQGAVIFPGEKYGLHSRVFINSLGLPTYEAKELGLAPLKYDYFPYDLSIIVTGAEIIEYFKVLLKALSLIRPELSEKTHHIPHGMVRLPHGKMSSRTGNVITGEWVLDEAMNLSKKKIAESKKTKENVSDEVSEIVGKGAVKYAMLKSSIGKDIEFNFEESISFEGNSGPYLQYTYVRTRSVLDKAQGARRKVQEDSLKTENWKLEIEELMLMRMLYQFSDVVVKSAKEYSPNTLCTYLYELAQAFNNFYQKHKVIENGQYSEFRLQLTGKVGEVIKEGLEILGIQAPEKM